MRDEIWLPAGAVTHKDVGGSPHGGFDGYAAVFGNVDQQDDIVVAGAFRKSLARRAGRPFPLVADHDHSVDGVIGSVTAAREDAYGLHVRAAFSSTRKAQDVRTKVREGHLSGLSIFGPIVAKSYDYVAGRQVRKLTEVDLIEVTVTPFPANVRALVSTAKAGEEVAMDTSTLVDRYLAEARKAGWRSPGVGYVPHAINGGVYDGGGNLCCGECTPCKARNRSQCIAKNTPAAVANAGRRARMREDWAVEVALKQAEQAPSGYAAVMSETEYIERGAKRATLQRMLDELS